MRTLLTKIISLPKQLALLGIGAYQALLSPDHSWLKVKYPYGYCRHYPSCSEYSRQAIGRYGLIRGGWLSAKRIVNCSPLSEPKVDPVPNH